MAKFKQGDYIVCTKKLHPEDTHVIKSSGTHIKVEPSTILKVTGEDDSRYQIENFVVGKSARLDGCFEKITFEDGLIEIGNNVACINDGLNRLWKNKLFKVVEINGNEIKVEGRPNSVEMSYFKKVISPVSTQIPAASNPPAEKFKEGDEVVIIKGLKEQRLFFGGDISTFIGLSGDVSSIIKDFQNEFGEVADRITIRRGIMLGNVFVHPDEIIKVSDITPEIGNIRRVGNYYAGQKVIQSPLKHKHFPGTNSSTIFTVKGFERNVEHTMILDDGSNKEFKIKGNPANWDLLPAQLISNKIDLVDKVIKLIKTKSFIVKSETPKDIPTHNFFQYIGDETDDEEDFVHEGWLFTHEIDYIDAEFDYFILDEKNQKLTCIGTGADAFAGKPISIKEKINERIEKGIFDLEKPNIDVNKNTALNYLFKHLTKLNIKGDSFNMLIKINDENAASILNQILERDNLEYTKEAEYIMKAILSLINSGKTSY